MNTTKALVAVVVIAALGVVVWFSLQDTRPHGVEVQTEAATRQDLSSRVKATGEIVPERKVEISAKVVGEIINLPVVEGQHVSEGQLLVEIERDLYEAARNRARAALDQTRVAVQRNQVQLADARRTLRRTRELHRDGLMSQEGLDAAQLAVDTAQVELEAARHAVAQQRSALDQAQEDLNRTTIRSPMNGMIIQLDAERGETVVPGSTNLPGSVIMTVADMSRLLAEVEVSEVDVVEVELDQPAEVSVEALGSDPLPGHVVEIATSGRRDPQQGTIRFGVKVAIEDLDPDLRPAMTAKVDILTATREDALTVPIQAVVTRRLDASGEEVEEPAGEERDVVYTITDGEAEARPVDTGIADELTVEITAGLEPDEEVVVGPYRTLKNLSAGDPVHLGETSDADEDE